MRIDQETKGYLFGLENKLNEAIDRLIIKRDSAQPCDKYPYRYITRQLERCLGEIHKAQDKVKNKS